VKLYSSWLSPFAGRCRMQIYAKGIAAEILDLPGNPKPAVVYALNPIGKVPTLEHDGVVVVESEVIAEYLEEIHPEPSLLPASAVDRARVRTLARVADLYVTAPAFTLFAQVDPRSRDEAAVRAALDRIEKGLGYLEHFLAGDPYAVGDRLTLADCALVPHLGFSTLLRSLFAEDDACARHPKLAAYRVESRRGEAAARVLGEIERAFAGLRQRFAERFAAQAMPGAARAGATS
jgi:glutathione S-transferase